MSDTFMTEQQQIFDASIDAAELEAVNALVNKHKANAALTQQLALDASRLVTTSQERLVQQSEAGFFKRLASAISGKTSENQLQNQMDMLQVQRFSWHYLQQLQQQNLISAQGIAVIRNNLGTMNDYIIETRDFLELAIDRIDRRLQHVETNTAFNNWALNIEANKRRFKSIPKSLLILRLTYDFLCKHQEVRLTERDVNNYLITTLEKLDINCDEDIKLLDFVSELIDQIDLVGIEQYRATIDLSFDEHTVDSTFIQKNISGIGINALYLLSDHYEKITALIGDDDLCNSDEAREKIISTFFGKELLGLAATCSVRNLICEMIGGSQLAIDVYKEVNGLNVSEEEIPAAPIAIEDVTLVSSMPEIQKHTFLDGGSSDESKRNYVLLLALCAENSASLNAIAREFIAQLAEKAGAPGLEQAFLELADNPRKHNEHQPRLQALLDTEDKKYTWLLDAFFLLTLSQKAIESTGIKVLLGALKPAQLKECLPAMQVVVGGDDETQVLDAAHKLAAETHGWKNVIRYRELRFDRCFGEHTKRLSAAEWKIIGLMADMGSVYIKAMEHSFFVSFSDGSLMGKIADKAAASVCSLGRGSALSGLNEYRKKARDLIAEHRSALWQANSLISRWSGPEFEFKDEMSVTDYDLDNSADNEDWGDQFGRYHRQVEDALNSFSRACSDATEQIKFFMKGDFDQSVIQIREQRRAEHLQKQELEKLEKQSVTITKDGKEHLFSIEWQQVQNPPCNPSNISHIETNGNVWLIVAKIDSDEYFYRSEDGLNWQQVQLDTPNFTVWFDGITVVNGMWIVRNRALSRGTREAGIYYSSDALNWRHNAGPAAANNSSLSLDEGRISYHNIIHFNGTWLWICTQDQQYSYVEKGFFSDSTKSSSYAKTILFCADTLDGPWQRSDHTPKLADGVKAEKICALPGKNALLAFCEYDWSYVRNKKKPETPPFVMYYGAAKSWQTCAWGGGSSFRYQSTPLAFANVGEGWVMFMGSEILTSDKGYDWKLQETASSFDGYFPLNDFSLFTSNSNGSIRLTQDAKQFKELMLEEGVWRHVAANEQGALGVYYANKHEETVLRVGRYRCVEKG